MTRNQLLIIGIFLFACSVKPEPIQYGKDGCFTCKMTIMDKRFGGEVVSTKGKVFKFDDANCMIGFLNSGYLEEANIAHRLVIDFNTPEKLVMAENAFYIKSDQLKTPMASQVAAFEEKSKSDSFKKEFNGIYLTWGEVVTQFK
ncbi:MAG: nitrous oxide reductase accessory protein NosL [Cyclobacteriaceae bacterium]|nr:nitrous oxide reductase accessory protein NosL [Cyclobacteriaceae bacterium]